jgi:multidrug efflux pump
MAVAYGGNYVNWFPMQGLNYKVVPQVKQRFRLVPEDLNRLYIRTGSQSQTGSNQVGAMGTGGGGPAGPGGGSASGSLSGLNASTGGGASAGSQGTLIPLSTVAKLRHIVVPNQLTHFQQLNSATVEAVLGPLVTMGQGLKFLQDRAQKYMPTGMSYDYAGESRQFIQEGSGLIVTFFISFIVIYLVLSAQFESFRDPFIILISVPMSICGALIFLNLGSTFTDALTINIYTQVGLITLIGLISKHGILMVEFANQLQAHEGLSIREAIEKSAATRLRPILMTTAAMVLGVVPLLLASGAGAQSRFAIGVVIFTGMLIGTFFTLFVVPTMYTFIAKKHQPLQTPEDHVE